MPAWHEFTEHRTRARARRGDSDTGNPPGQNAEPLDRFLELHLRLFSSADGQEWLAEMKRRGDAPISPRIGNDELRWYAAQREFLLQIDRHTEAARKALAARKSGAA